MVTPRPSGAVRDGISRKEKEKDMAKTLYAAVVRDDGEGGFWAEFPDLPGCYGHADTFLGCVSSASDGLETHLAAMEADGRPLPEATDPDAADGRVVWLYADTSTVDLGEPSMTAADAARELGVTPARVSQLIAAGRLDARRVGGMTLVTVGSVEAYAATPRAPGRPRRDLVTAGA